MIHIIRMCHSKILIDFPTSTWPQSSIKTVTGANFFNPEQTCQNEEKNLRTKPDMPSLCYEFTFKFSPAEQRPERGKVTTFLHYISPCSSSLFPRGSCNSGVAFSGWIAVPSKASLLLAYSEHSLVRSSSVQECDSYLKILIVEGKYLLE